MLTGIKYAFSTRGIPNLVKVENELNFIKKYTAQKYECLILSQRQGIYYAELNLASPLKGPGLIEMILQADFDQLMGKVLEGNIQCVFLSNSNVIQSGPKLDTAKILEKYSIIAINSLNTMLYLEQK